MALIFVKPKVLNFKVWLKKQVINFYLGVIVHNTISNYVGEDFYSFEWNRNTFLKPDQSHRFFYWFMC